MDIHTQIKILRWLGCMVLFFNILTNKVALLYWFAIGTNQENPDLEPFDIIDKVIESIAQFIQSISFDSFPIIALSILFISVIDSDTFST